MESSTAQLLPLSANYSNLPLISATKPRPFEIPDNDDTDLEGLDLEQLERLFMKISTENDVKIRECQASHRRTQILGRELRDIQNETEKTKLDLQLKDTKKDQLKRDLELISKQCTADENECNAALSAYKTLDATFGPQYRILQKLMDQSDWNFATFELLIKEQSEISKRAQKIGNSDDHKLRAREMAALRKEHQQLQQENSRLHATKMTLKRKLVSANRDAEFRNGVRRFAHVLDSADPVQ